MNISNRDNLILYALHLYKECSKKGWDSYDGVPISNMTVLRFIKLLDLLPLDLIPPDGNFVGPCSDGRLELELPCKSASMDVGPDDNNVEFDWFTETEEQIESFSLDQPLSEKVIAKIRELQLRGLNR